MDWLWPGVILVGVLAGNALMDAIKFGNAKNNKSWDFVWHVIKWCFVFPGLVVYGIFIADEFLGFLRDPWHLSRFMEMQLLALMAGVIAWRVLYFRVFRLWLDRREAKEEKGEIDEVSDVNNNKRGNEMDWKDDILNGLAPIIKLLIREVLGIVLQDFIEKNPEDAKLVMFSTYPGIDVKLQKLVKDTETDLDDAVVDGTLEAFEAVAKKNGFELPNLDDD